MASGNGIGNAAHRMPRGLLRGYLCNQ